MNSSYQIEQFEDKGLAHYSYAILSGGKIALVDPARNPKPYLDFAERHGATITAVIETHPHADFVSGHLEIAQATGADIYVSKLVGAAYPHTSFDDGDVLELGEVTLHSMNTPGHSPDSISILLMNDGKQEAMFSGDTLFVGDVGRPDLREKAGNITAKREELARMMYQTVQNRLKPLEDQVLVYPAHGAGSLCGKALSSAAWTTIGAERMTNYAFREMTEDEFVAELTSEQPHIPKYFGNSVGMNRNGAPSFETSVNAVPRLGNIASDKLEETLEAGILVIDTRPDTVFKQGHLKGALNIQKGGKFDTWLGSITGPDEMFYLIAESEEIGEWLVERTAAIGYEKNIKGVLTVDGSEGETLAYTDTANLVGSPEKYTIVDVRGVSEAAGKPIFKDALVIPLPEIRERIAEIPTDKPVAIHCAAGYRSAAAASILAAAKPDLDVSDVGDAIKTIAPQA